MSTHAKDVIVITGGSGFVGTHLQRELDEYWSHVEVISWDLPVVDITNPATYAKELKALQPTWVVHLAAIAAVGVALKNPELAHQVNVEGTRKLLEAIKIESPRTKVLVISSADIYGNSDYAIAELPLDQCQPRNPYAQSKLDMERMIEDRFTDITIRVRPFPHIGPGQNLGFVTADFASQIVAIEQGKKEAVMKVGNLEAKRDFTDVRDVVRAYRLLMERSRLGEVFNIASGKAIQIKDILDQLLSLSKADITVENDPDRMRPSDIPILIGDATKLHHATDWEPRIPLEETLQEILEYWREN